MRAEASSRLAWSLWALCLAVVVGGLLLGVVARPEAPLYEYWLEDALISPTFATLGALIVSRRPGNVIGWIFLFCGAGSGVQLFSGQYATVALLSEGPSYLTGGATAAWLSTLAQISIVLSALFLILLFPTGRLLSPRWRPVAHLAGGIFVISVVSRALTPGQIEDFPSARNPFGVEAAAGVLNILDTVGGWAGLACFGAAIFSLVLRFYRSRGEERLQLKWFAYASTLGFLAILLGGESIIGSVVWSVAPLGLPAAAGIAILRYRLYDIDLIINRTLVYGSLTVTLALVYLGSVVVLQEIVRALTGGESQLAVVASTLVIAALFNPLRRRIQSFIDRRFYRTRYDAAKTLEAYSARLRDETDVGELSNDLLGVVHETVHPEHASLWLRPSKRHKSLRKSYP